MKKALIYFVALAMLIMTLVVPTERFWAYEANLSVEVSASTVNIGDVVTVTVKVPGAASGPVSLYFPTELFECVEKSKNMNQVGGTIQISIGVGGLEKSESAVVKLKAKTSGKADIKVEATGDIYDDSTYEEVVLKSASTSVTVENKAVEPGPSETPTPSKSDDNSLASLKLSSGTLSPSFEYNVTNYTATVGYDVTKVVVSATPSNEKAVIESVTSDGNVNLEVGENTIQVVVRAENGVKATYTVVVTRKEESKPVDPEPSEGESSTDTETDTTDPDINEVLQWNGEQLYVTDGVPTEKIPSDFESKLLVINGEQMQGLSFKKANLVVLYLNNTNGAGSLYVYDEAKKSVYPFVKIAGEQSYVMVLSPDEETLAKVPEGYEKCTLSIEGKGGVTAFQRKERTVKASEFYLLYCMNNAGEMGWYIYDTVEETFIRYFEETPSTPVGGDVSDDTEWQNKYAALEKELNAAKMTQYIIIAIAAAVVIILIIVILVLALKKRGQEEDILEEEDSSEEEAKENETVVLEQKQEETVIAEEATVTEETVVVEEAVTEETTVEETVEEENKVEENTEEEFVVDTMTEAVKIERKPREADKTSKFSSKKDEESDLEFIDFE